jgi:hypothetical protein
MKRGKEEGERGNENVPGSNDRTVARVRDLLKENLHRHEGRSETGTDDELRNHEQGESLAFELRDACDATEDGTDEHGRSVPLYEGRWRLVAVVRRGTTRREKREKRKEKENSPPCCACGPTCPPCRQRRDQRSVRRCRTWRSCVEKIPRIV